MKRRGGDPIQEGPHSPLGSFGSVFELEPWNGRKGETEEERNAEASPRSAQKERRTKRDQGIYACDLIARLKETYEACGDVRKYDKHISRCGL